MKWYYDQHVQQVSFQVGDKVLLDLCNYQKVYCKLAAYCYGLFTIEEKLLLVTFRLKWPNNLNKIHPVFHASKLSLYNEEEFVGQKFTLSGPELIDDHEEFEVEKTLILEWEVVEKTDTLNTKLYGRDTLSQNLCENPQICHGPARSAGPGPSWQPHALR